MITLTKDLKNQIIKDYCKQFKLKFVKFDDAEKLLICSSKSAIKADGKVSFTSKGISVKYSGFEKVGEKIIYHVFNTFFDIDKKTGKVSFDAQGIALFTKGDTFNEKKYGI